MRAKINSFHSADINDLFNFKPQDPENFCFLLEMMIGPDCEEGEESFGIQVCTPIWLLSIMKKEDVIPGRHFLIVLEYNFERIYKKIKHLIENCTGADWSEVAEKVSRIGYWEFEDYQDQ
jgi:hypothetical protein